MKIFSKIMLAIIFLFLIAISVVEDAVVSSSLKMAMDDCLYIEKLSDDKDDLRTMNIALAVSDLESDWKKNESNMCYLVNHKNIQEIGLEISKLKVYQKENDTKEFRASLEAIKLYSEGYLHFMGANLHNVL